MKNKKLRNVFISIFVIAWLLLFNYESTRFFYLNPLAKKHFDIELPKTKFLFPPAGWIMFFNVDNTAGYAEVYGVRNGKTQFIDPHEIISTRTVMFDNIHRNILSGILSRGKERRFCSYVKRKLPEFDSFVVTYAQYPKLDTDPTYREQHIIYQCQ